MDLDISRLATAVLTADETAIFSEESACSLVASARWPDGTVLCPKCKATCTRDLWLLSCGKHTLSIFSGTALGTLRRPRVRAILLAIRAILRSRRGISARELARDVGMPRNTLWRHIHRLRALLPRPAVLPTRIAAAVHVTGRTAGEHGHAIVGAINAMRARRGPARGGRRLRIVGESVRTWVNGTFHGVSAQWLHRYLQEAASRLAYDAALVADLALDAMLRPRSRVFFDRHIRAEP